MAQRQRLLAASRRFAREHRGRFQAREQHRDHVRPGVRYRYFRLTLAIQRERDLRRAHVVEQEYGDGAGYHTDYTDFAPYTQMINSEGAQYLYFAQHGVADRSEYAAVADVLGDLSSNFWLRTAYPLSIGDDDAGQFYQVMASGYPSTIAVATQKNKIIAGFCL